MFYNSTQQTNTGINQNPLQTSTLTKRLEVGTVELYVSNIKKEKDFFVDLVGLEVLEDSDSEITLGFDEREVVKLLLTKELPAFNVKNAGLYHIAIVFESRSALAQAVERILIEDNNKFLGSSDHVVSEAFYFSDPEGNGVELYYDRDPKSWVWQDGKVMMGSTYIDPLLYIQKYKISSESAAKKMGHIHLQVGDIEKAKQFYVENLGMHITAEMPTALFVSDGLYHHTIGMNTWNSDGALQRPETLGLKQFTLLLDSEEDITKLLQRLDSGNISYTYSDIQKSIKLEDPWRNNIIIGVE